MVGDISIELAREEMEKARVVKEGKILRLLREFPGGLTAIAVAKGTGKGIASTRVRLSLYKQMGKVKNEKRGIWTIVHSKNKVCLTCHNTGHIEHRSKDGIVSYSKCPDCQS